MAENAETKPNFFPEIGKVVDEAAKHPETEVVQAAADDDERAVQEIESLCMKCYQQGTTRLLLTSIPFFKEVIVMSFRCEHCGFQNNEIQSAGTIRPEGTVYTVRILSREDLNRQLVKSESCTVTIPEFELTIPPHRGQLTTVEGLLRDVATDLSGDQPLRRVENEAAYNKIQAIIDNIKAVLADNEDEEDDKDESGRVQRAADRDAPMKPFTVRLDDPAGNSFLEFVGSMADPKWNLRTYRRTRQQNVDLGLVAPDAEPEPTVVQEDQIGGGLEGENEEIYVFPGSCSSCGHKSDTYVKKVNIPYFKDILIMSVNCDLCGYRDNEVKSGAAISPKGRKITLKVEDKEDLSRDILKSESCGLAIPEIELVLQPGTLGGRFTTLEGILDQVYEELSAKVFNDAKTDDGAFEKFLSKLKAVKAAEHPFTLILDDPLANSYLQNLYAPDPDPNMTTEEYERTWEQNDDLGLNDMKVEGYEGDPNLPQNQTEQNTAEQKSEAPAS
ncbi:zf-ZPR1-domain-containing protein [Phanerochaete sordida]|uniref:Zf-ZPR1-domain-containing protein n=1 Tax=Phanerochaete sordida TaxID=48140 RepID=A0A9P3GAJ1_9APHY|nr:zf-ZPR1-domain-containing protein [Phanerochaete sordida]